MLTSCSSSWMICMHWLRSITLMKMCRKLKRACIWLLIGTSAASTVFARKTPTPMIKPILFDSHLCTARNRGSWLMKVWIISITTDKHKLPKTQTPSFPTQFVRKDMTIFNHELALYHEMSLQFPFVLPNTFRRAPLEWRRTNLNCLGLLLISIYCLPAFM